MLVRELSSTEIPEMAGCCNSTITAQISVTPNLGHRAANTAPAEIPQRQLPAGLWLPATSSRQDTVRNADVISEAKTQFKLFSPKRVPRGFSLQRG